MSEDKPLTGEEERQRLKEEYKKEMLEHKLKMQQLKNAATTNRRMADLNKALNEVEQAANTPEDEFLPRMQQETAEMEARLDMAISKAQPTTFPTPLELTENKDYRIEKSENETPELDAESRTLGDSVLSEVKTVQPAKDPIKQPNTSKTMGDEET